ncbi:MAG TPA: Calx-beta domain-containing protein [Xanthobacteraceae bacterium]|nr:Calx-beta domain-containing protein [Xanthobacteraceae bacterium]
MALGPGSIAFVGFNADGNDNLAFVVLQDIAAGTVITFTDNEWVGSAFNTGESTWTWTATSDLAAGAVVTMDNLAAGQTATSNLGTISYSEDTVRDIDPKSPTNYLEGETVYAYVGSASSPTFLTAISNGSFSLDEIGRIVGTGLTNGETARAIQSGDVAAYTGPRITGGDFSNFLKMINSPSNWAVEQGDGDQSANGTAPDAPFSTASFVIDPHAQKIAFSADSLVVTHEEGDSGATTYTFTVERTNGTTGAVSFSGAFARGTTLPADYVGGLPPTTFSGTIAEGESSATVTITIAGETAFEADESFSLMLRSATNGAATVYLSPVADELKATGIVVNDDTRQLIGFAADSANVFVTEGHDGTKVLTFTIERTGNGGTVGDVAFTGTFAADATDAGDFGGTLPMTFSGVIPDGQASTTVSITISGDAAAEINERFGLTLTSATNPAAQNIALGTKKAQGWILNDDGPLVVHSGETVSQAIGLSGDATLTIEQGGTVAGGFSLAGEDLDVTIDNAGLVSEAEFTYSNGNGRLTINNAQTGVIADQVKLPSFIVNDSLEVTINNAGTIAGGHKSIRSEGNFGYSQLTINNLATGVINSGADNATGIEIEGKTTINNAGVIMVPAQAGTTSAGKEGIEYHGTGNLIHNLAGGWIEGSHHAVTGDESAVIINEAGGTMIGRNGSAVNIDNDAGEEDTVTVINRGLMQGKSQHYADSDGDAVDVDGRVIVENWGTIEGLGHNGYHKGEPNVSEAIAAGAAVITNHEGGTLYGYGRAIQIDNSSNGDAFAATTIVNAGTIKGDGNLPTGVTPEEVAQFAQRIQGGEAIDIVGRNADSLTNSGQIVGGVKMGGGDDTVTNSGSMTATGGSAVDLGDGDDVFNAHAGSAVAGLLDGGDGADTLNLEGSGEGTLGPVSNIETVNVKGGDWTLGSDGFATVNFHAGAQTLRFSATATADGDIDGVIAGLGLGDAINLHGIGTATSATLGAGNVLTIDGGANGPITLQLDPAQDFTGKTFTLAADGNGGTTLTLDLGPGSIAFTGYNSDGNDALAFVALTDLPAGTVIYFTDNEWRGTAFNTGESVWSWTATQDVAAGTIVTMNSQISGALTSNLGNAEHLAAPGLGLTGAGEVVYAYVGSANAPTTFLTAFANDSLLADGATLSGTGLVEGLTAVSLDSYNPAPDIAAYDGPRLGSENFADYLSLINNPANWVQQDGGGDQSGDGITPDLPFSLAGFSDDPAVQVVNVAAGSLAVSQAEGDSGETMLTFTIERSGGTTGTVNFSGTITPRGTTRADDFGGTLPATFSGTIADGATSGTVTIHVSGDVTFEADDAFVLSLTGVASSDVSAVLGTSISATGTIANDDPAPVQIAFVGLNADGTDNVAFVAVSDIPAGTVIHFTVNAWQGDSFNTGEGVWSWTADAAVSAGTIVTMDDLNSGAATSNLGTITFSSPAGAELDHSVLEVVYAYLGTPDQPEGFLTAIATGAINQQNPLLANTGLTLGVNAIALGSLAADADVAYYNGPRTGFTDVAAYLPQIHDPANWIVQDNDQADNSADGIAPDVPLPAMPFSTDPTVQVVEFAAGSFAVSQSEGDAGASVTFTFTVERTNGTTGDLTFTALVMSDDFVGAAGPEDFGGAFPTATGTILDGQTSTTVSITVAGDALYEVDEKFRLVLQSASNPNASSVVLGNDFIAVGTIANDDAEPSVIHAGETVTRTILLSNGDDLTVEAGGVLDLKTPTASVTNHSVLIWSGTGDSVVNNYGSILGPETSQARVVRTESNTSGSFTFNNHEGGYVYGDLTFSSSIAPGTVITINNAGTIDAPYRAVEMTSSANNGQITLNNLATGVITGDRAGQDIIRGGKNVVINNAGQIVAAADADGQYGGDAIDYQNGTGGVVHNFSGGYIEGSRHAITGDRGITVINDLNGVIVGRNGSAVNIDNGSAESDRVFVTNHGTLRGQSMTYSDSDGDAIDTDGLATIENYGSIEGLGHNGYHDGEPNISEAIAIGGGTINNYAGATISGYGRAIQIDNSENGPAFAATTIYNEGTIRGDGNDPAGVSPEDAAAYAVTGDEAVNLVGNWADTITNKGAIVGGVDMGGGDDTLTNSGSMTATGGSAVDLGDGNDTLTNTGIIAGDVLMGGGDDLFVAVNGSTVTGTIDGGEGEDELRLTGAGLGALGVNTGFERLDVQGGFWTTLAPAAYDEVHVAVGASMRSGLSLTDGGALTVDVGGSVMVTTGAAVSTAGSAQVANAGLIAGLGLADAPLVVVGGGSIDNTLGGTILAQGTAISVGNGGDAVAAVAISNDGTIHSMSGEAIAIAGEHDDTLANRGIIQGSVALGGGGDTLVNRGSIVGNVALGDGDDSLTIHRGSSITGTIDAGEGYDEVRLVGDSLAGGTLGAVAGFEKLVVEEGAWSIAGSAAYSEITVQDGAAITSSVLVDGNDHLTVEAGGAIENGVQIADHTTGVVIDNAGTIRAGLGGTVIGQAGQLNTGDITIVNRESGSIHADSGQGAVYLRSADNFGSNSKFVLDNAGRIDTSDGTVIRLTNLTFDSIVIHNRQTGEIIGSTASYDVIRAAEGIHAIDDWAGNPDLVKIFNDGVIKHLPDTADAAGGDAIDFASGGGTVVNSATGLIEGSRHGITGKRAAIVENDGVIIGRSGSAVNIDNDDSEEQRVHVVNRGTMQGRSVAYENSDGDAIDVDGLLTLDNYGSIEGLGHYGYHSGEPNVSEGVAVGGGIINNYAGGTIYGYGRAIQIDDSENGEAFGATAITNAGLIKGDGHLPAGVTPEDVAQFAGRLQGGEAINIVGHFADSLTNSGTIVGGVRMGGGDDTLTNSGTMTATGGSAIDMGEGDDTLNVLVGSAIAGAILGGAGHDTVNLGGVGAGAFGAATGFEDLVVEEGTWSVAGTSAYADITVQDGATLSGPVELTGDHTLTIEQGGVLAAISPGDNAIEFSGPLTGATIDNAGTITGQFAGTFDGLEHSFTLLNRESGVIRFDNFNPRLTDTSAGANGVVVIDNAGLIEGVGGHGLDLRRLNSTSVTIYNRVGGEMIADAPGGFDALRPSFNNAGIDQVTIYNDGLIRGGNDGIDMRSGGGTIHNSATGRIEGAKHGVTGEKGMVITNAAGGVMIGHNGSAVNIDNDSDIADTVVVVNRGLMEGRSAETEDSDGDAIDVDGMLQLDNYGSIRGLGHEGYHKGEPNVSEGLAIGRGMIRNYAGAEIYGYGRGIEIDDSNNGSAFGASTIYNYGLIQGDGHGPEGVDPADAAGFDLRGNEGIRIVGNYADTLTNMGTIIGGVSMGGGDDVVNQAGTITATGGSALDLGAGNDRLNVLTGAVITGDILGGDGLDTVTLLGTGAGSLGATSGVETLVVRAGAWSVAGGEAFDAVTIENGATVTSRLVVDDSERLTIRAGGRLLVAGDAIYWQGGNVVVDNAGLIEASGRVFDTRANSTGSFTFNNLAGGVVRGAISPRQEVTADSVFTVNNAGLIENNGRIFDLKELVKDGAHAVINNLAGGIIRQSGSGGTDVTRLDDNTVVNNWGTMMSAVGFAGGGDLLDFDSGRGGVVHNYAGGLLEGARHAVTGKQDITIVNDGTMIGRNGSAVNMDTDGSVAETVHVTNHGLMEGRSAELADSDGDAIDVDGLLVLHNYGRVAGLGAEGYHNGEPNVSEAIAIGGGEITNYAGGEIYGYGRAIQVDNSSNSNALGATTIVNAGLIQGDGHGPEGVAPEDAARFDLDGNEAVNLVGDYADSLTNSGSIVGGVSMGGGNDMLVNSGSMTATGGSAIDMGAGDDTVLNLAGGEIGGSVLLGEGADRFVGNASAEVVDGGAGDDTLTGGGGNDQLAGGSGADILFGGEDDDQLTGGAGADILFGGAGADRLDGGADNDQMLGEGGADVFVFRAGYGHDTVLDFAAGDAVELDAAVFADFAALQTAGALTDTGLGAQIAYADGSTLLLTGVATTSLSADDFRFV